ncbi:MAG: metallophosphoesterase family protein [Aliishimia sp.]
MQFLKRIIAKKHRFSGELSPERAFIAIGDIHGRADLMTRLLEKVASGPYADLPIIFVGDYVDRGENSAIVLRDLMVRSQAAPSGQLICLRGNHEEMMLNFIEDPVQHGPRWLRYGGLETMASFKAPFVAQTAPEDEWIAARDVLVEAMTQDMIRWLYALPAWWQTGNIAVVHAGADPKLPMIEQDENVLVWGHRRFDEEDRTDGLWIVHGHTIVDNAIAESGRISVDTGAYATGTLSAAVVRPGDVSFLVA